MAKQTEDRLMAAGPEGAFSLQRSSSRKRPAWKGEPTREEQAAWWAWRVRHLAALKLAWFRQCIRPDLDEAERGRRLHANEVAQRQAKADLWRATPDCTRWCGEGKYRFPLEKDTDRHQAIIALEHEASELFGAMCRVRTDRYRRRRGLPPIDRDATIEPDPNATHHGPYDVDLDDLPGLLAMPVGQMVQHLEIKKLMSNPGPRRYKPGQVPQPGAATPPPPKPPRAGSPPQGQPAPGRPQPPRPVTQTVQGAMEVEMPFGKYRGQLLGDLLEDDEGLSYLWWLANEATITSNRLQQAVETLYEVHEDECIQARRGSWR